MKKAWLFLLLIPGLLAAHPWQITKIWSYGIKNANLTLLKHEKNKKYFSTFVNHALDHNSWKSNLFLAALSIPLAVGAGVSYKTYNDSLCINKK